MFLRRIDVSMEWIPHVARAMFEFVGSLACGRNLWSGIGKAASGGLSVAQFASIPQ